MFALNQGEVCTCPSRALIQESIYDRFIERAVARVAAIKQGNPLDMDTMIGAQASSEQMEKILSYMDIGNKEGAELLIGGARAHLPGELSGGYYVQPTVFKGHNKMRIFQEEIFGPVLSVTTFKTPDEALSIANDTLYGLGAGRVEPRHATPPSAWAAAFRPAVSGPTATTTTRHAAVRRLQAVGHWPRKPQNDAGPLPADQELAGQLQREQARFLLIAEEPLENCPAQPTGRAGLLF